MSSLVFLEKKKVSWNSSVQRALKNQKKKKKKKNQKVSSAEVLIGALKLSKVLILSYYNALVSDICSPILHGAWNRSGDMAELNCHDFTLQQCPSMQCYLMC